MGVDPEDAQQLWHLLNAYAHRRAGSTKPFTVVVALSRIYEAATFCDRMGILIGGTLSWCGMPHEFADKFSCAFHVELKVFSNPF